MSKRKSKLSNVSNIRFTNNLGKYLGFNIVHGHVTNSHFDFLLERVQRCLSNLEGKIIESGRESNPCEFSGCINPHLHHAHSMGASTDLQYP